MEHQTDYFVFVVDPAIFQQTKPSDNRHSGHPEPGWGARAFLCDRYEICLTIAANGDWQGFHCESCFYKNRGFLCFYIQEFFDPEPDEPILH